MDYINKNTVNVAVQVLPVSQRKDSYAIVDEAIKVIKDSGVKHVVCPFETVMEGNYTELMQIVQDVQNVCYQAGADTVMCYVKIQTANEKAVTIEDKIEKYV